MDILSILYNELIKDEYIIEKANGRIKYYEYPETGDVTNPFIIIDPMDTPMYDDHADNIPLTLNYMVQIDVWSLNRLETLHLANRISDVLKKFGCGVIPGPDEYDKETKIFRIAKRYTGKLYRDNII